MANTKCLFKAVSLQKPAIKAQLTDHRWTVAELLTWKRLTSEALRTRLLEGIA